MAPFAELRSTGRQWPGLCQEEKSKSETSVLFELIAHR